MVRAFHVLQYIGKKQNVCGLGDQPSYMVKMVGLVEVASSKEHFSNNYF